MHEYDEAILKCFLDNQLQLLPEPVASNIDEAEAFLEECVAVVVDSIDEVWDYFDAQGVDLEGQEKEEIVDAPEVFDIGDGRYLIVES
ncbi:MAG: glyoxalase [Lachnospiraceae bacterium]|jgi:hypothetical protein|nr:glyoxalase [Lachnospiraceae bacterium]MCI9399269.1 glyoxalase [Lachnospiraceae bacterium]MCX4375385.1 glyoxalase [Lachnospiraceae bacterium]